MALGHMLVLVQCDWPSMRDLLYLTLHRIKMKQVCPVQRSNVYFLEQLFFAPPPPILIRIFFSLIEGMFVWGRIFYYVICQNRKIK